jgi:hypothetical protein
MTTDYLAFEVIKALRKTDMAESWIKDKEHEFKRHDKTSSPAVLSNLDSDNLKLWQIKSAFQLKTCKQHY